MLPGSTHEISLFTDGRGGKEKNQCSTDTIFRISFSWEVEDGVREGRREGGRDQRALRQSEGVSQQSLFSLR